MARAVFFLTSLLLSFLTPSVVSAQQRPLRTVEAETLPAGTVRVQVGFDFLQDVTFPLSGLSGDQTSVAAVGIRMGIGRLVEVQLEGAVRQFLDVKQQGVGPITPMFTSPNSTHDVGDFSLFTKFRILSETPRRPAVALRFGFQLPTSNQVRGIGTNTSNIFAGLIVQKHFGRLNLFGNAGIAILQAPTATFTQNDAFTYGAAFIYSLHPKLNVVGEVAGRTSPRTITPALVGTESRSESRLGLQFFAGGFQWDVGAIAGLTRRDATTGFTFGISKDIRLFDYGSK